MHDVKSWERTYADAKRVGDENKYVGLDSYSGYYNCKCFEELHV